MIDFLKTKWGQGLIAVLLFITVLVAIYFVGKGKGKSKKYDVNLPTGGAGIPVETDEQGNEIVWSPEPLAKEGYRVMSGLAWKQFLDASLTQERVEWYARLTALTDDQLVAVYNAFNSLYISKGNGTMTDWIRDEYNLENSEAYNKVIVRLENLKLLGADPEDL